MVLGTMQSSLSDAVDPPSQIPTPCSACAAPMREAQRASSAVLECPYCQRTEPLPEQARERAAFLRSRLRHLDFAQARATGMAKLAAQGIRRNLLVYAGVLLFVGAQGAIHLFGSLEGLEQRLAVLPPEQRAQLWVRSLSGYITSLAPILGMLLGYGLSMAYAQRKIRPLLAARGPDHAGGPLRCRCCGGPLPAVTDAFVDCEYCGAQNLVTGEVAQRVALVWEEAAKGYGLRVNHAARELQQACRPWIFYGTWGGSLVAAWLIPNLLMRLF